jgi:ribosomal protein L37E
MIRAFRLLTTPLRDTWWALGSALRRIDSQTRCARCGVVYEANPTVTVSSESVRCQKCGGQTFRVSLTQSEGEK